MKRVREFAWAIVNREGRIVYWKAGDGEEGSEIHRTRRLASGAKFKGERVVKVYITSVPISKPEGT